MITHHEYNFLNNTVTLFSDDYHTPSQPDARAYCQEHGIGWYCVICSSSHQSENDGFGGSPAVGWIKLQVMLTK